MRRKDHRASWIKTTATVTGTVTVCMTILFLLQPWRTPHSGTEAERPGLPGGVALSANEATTEKTHLAYAASEIPGDAAAGDDETEALDEDATGGEIRLASRRGNLRAPVPEKNRPVPLPERNDLRAKKPADAEPAKPVKEAERPQPTLQPAAIQLAAAVPTAPVEEETEAAAGSAHAQPKAEFDDALAPLLSYSVPDGDLAALKDVVRHINNDDYADARALLETLRDPVAVKLARWYFYRRKAPDTTAQEIDDFLDHNPRWPDQAQLRDAAEDALFWREQK